ncbi:cobalamin B12-binding domain-containing protein [Actinophytocola sp.]|uniref:cobalamin B12-binding domain-containing protein n=1 Tax=Actinophytocola sp. TaxID=1872138 RepID=UPI00389A8A85
MTLTEEWSAELGVCPGLDVLVTSVASDSHTWNLVYLQLALEELGHRVYNLGACVPDDLLVAQCRLRRPDLVVVSSLNGHGRHDGLRVIEKLRACQELAATAVVIGGKLGIRGPGRPAHTALLRAAGYDEVFGDGAGIGSLAAFMRRLVAEVRP